MKERSAMSLTRRELLKLGGAAFAAGTTVDLLSPPVAPAQTPKRGGVFRLRLAVSPVHFDPHQTLAFSTMVPLSFTHSRLVKVKAGPAVKSGTTPLEADLAESWTRIDDTTYVFRLKRGVRWHNKPPVNGRELTAEDVKYSYERYLTVKGNPNRGILEQVDKIETLDKYTVRFTLREPFAWFLDALASTSTWIIPREAVEQHGDLKKPEAVIGTGPWMLERYEPNVRFTWVRHPNYFVPGLPYADGVEMTLDADPSSALAAWLSGKYDFAPEYGMVVRRLDFDLARQRKPGLQFVEHVPVFGGITWMKLDQEPFKDLRVRRALARASNYREVLESLSWAQGHGVMNPGIPAAFTEWSIPIDQLPPEGRELYEHDTADARRLLSQAGFPSGFKTSVETTAGYGPDYMDTVQVTLKNWKVAGVEAELKLKEYGAFVSSTIFGKFEKMAVGLFGVWADPDSYLYRYYVPGQITNAGGVDDPKLTEMIRLQRRTFDLAKRREIIYDIQRYLAKQVYYIYGVTPRPYVAWEPYVKNFSPNIGHDYGGRLMAAWLDK